MALLTTFPLKGTKPVDLRGPLAEAMARATSTRPAAHANAAKDLQDRRDRLTAIEATLQIEPGAARIPVALVCAAPAKHLYRARVSPGPLLGWTPPSRPNPLDPALAVAQRHHGGGGGGRVYQVPRAAGAPRAALR